MFSDLKDKVIRLAPNGKNNEVRGTATIAEGLPTLVTAACEHVQWYGWPLFTDEFTDTKG
jgi:hypothetical protein